MYRKFAVLAVVCLCPALSLAQGTKGGAQPPAGAAGQPPANQAARIQMYGQINQTPWFANQAVRTQLNLTNDQFTRLNTAYGQLYGPHDQAMNAYRTNQNLTDVQRGAMTTLNNRFYGDFGRAANGILTPEQQTRFNQLSNQYRGYDLFNDPTAVERLNITQDQRNMLNRYQQDYDAQLRQYYASLQTNPDANGARLNELRQNMYDRINGVWNNDQRDWWKRNIYGEILPIKH